MARCSTMNENQPFRILKLLGEGGYGIVHLVDHDRFGRVAYKTCPGASTDRRAELESEAEQHRTLRHPNVVTLYDTIFNSKCCGLFIEYLKYGEVNEFIKRFKVPPELRTQILYETACGMFYLHGNQPVIIHGDLTCQNILIGEGFHAKIADFGLSRSLKENYENSKTVTILRGKPVYIAPEYFTDPSKRKTEKFDVYGFAISAWEILSQKRAYHACTDQRLIPIFVERGDRPDMREVDMSIPNTIKQLIEKCWHQSDKERPGFGSIKDQLFVLVSKMQFDLRRAYISLMEQEKMTDLSTDMKPGDMSNTLTITPEVNRSTNTSVSSKLASMKLENNNDGRFTNYSKVYPGSSTTENTVHQNTSTVLKSGRTEPAPINSSEANPKHKKEIEVKSPGNTSIPRRIQSPIISSQSGALQLSSGASMNDTEEQTGLLLTFEDLIRWLETPSNSSEVKSQKHRLEIKPMRRSMQINNGVQQGKLENNNDAGSPSISTVKPGSFTTENTAYQNTPKVVRSDRAEPAPIKSPKLNVKHALPFNPQAVAIWNDKLYLPVPYPPDIRVYNTDPFAFQRTITVDGMKIPYGIVASENVLYVSEDKLIHRIQLPEESVSNWTVDGSYLLLSIAKNGNVIVACNDLDKIFEYTSFGNLVREIVVNRFDANLIALQHAIQMEGDKFLVCHTETTHRRVCMIDNTGRVIKCYGGNKGSGIGQLNLPTHLAIDRNGFILVADHDNNRIVQLNSSLEYISETVGIQQPIRILLNEERGRLYVIESNDQSLTVFDV